ncbi:MAG: 16S rRNA (uracil(1498)-N(3))-methyltransferase [Oscillospiraceae bacterium]|nr:16S rRNA (uracil(1498)-N(3))-methyltransferase [Oscillospiraceae bacterium]
MARFFVDRLPEPGSLYELTGENAAHAKVLRLEPGETVTLCDGAGTDCVCTVAQGLQLLAGEAVPSQTEPRVSVSVYLAFPKADKAEHVIQKATELGAAEIVLFPTRFCVSRPDDKSLAKKLERWQKIARSAAEQSRRGRIPKIRALPTYAGALAEAANADLPILFYENERARTLREALTEVEKPIIRPSVHTGAPSPEGEGIAPMTISLMTGAEGGFASEEIAGAEAAGMKICTLGTRILRCETAPLAALSAVMYACGEM